MFGRAATPCEGGRSTATALDTAAIIATACDIRGATPRDAVRAGGAGVGVYAGRVLAWASGPAAGNLPPAPTVGRLLTDWHPQPVLIAVLAAVAGLYGWGVLRLRRRGVRWPAARTLSFLVGGTGVAAFATASGLAAYDDVLFSAHMAQHMLLTMLAPAFLALGAPVTLALRALPTRGRRRLVAVLHSRAAAVVTFPVLTTFLFIGSPFALYFSPLYGATLRSEPLHLLLHAHFLLVGCLFLWPVLGVDPMPRRLAYPLRLLLVFVTMPFHAFLGVAILSQQTVLAGQWYAGFGRTWGASPLSDQQTGGGLLWAAGDLIGLLLVITVLAQWMSSEERWARQEDRRLDRELGAGAELAAYNARLAALARRDSPIR